MADVYEDLLAERLAQNAEFGGPEADDVLAWTRWLELIDKHLDRAAPSKSVTARRYAMVRVAALAVAAVQSLDRQWLPCARCGGTGKVDQHGEAYATCRACLGHGAIRVLRFGE